MAMGEKSVFLIGHLNPIDVATIIAEIEATIERHFTSSKTFLRIDLFFSINTASREASITLANYLLFKKEHNQNLAFTATNIGIVCYNALPAFMTPQSRYAMQNSIFLFQKDLGTCEYNYNDEFLALISQHPESKIGQYSPTHSSPADPTVPEMAKTMGIINQII